MKNYRVQDWKGFASNLRKTGTQNVDLRKMKYKDTQEEI